MGAVNIEESNTIAVTKYRRADMWQEGIVGSDRNKEAANAGTVSKQMVTK